jgi:thioredoxin-related protein
MKYILNLLLFLPVVLHSQNGNTALRDSFEKGIHFENSLNWDEILQKAREEKKMIFIDCYTTWCTPCKAMEKEIYPLESVGQFFNEHFVSIKIQMDQTANDNDQVKQWYQDAKKIEKKYSIDAYPTFLFLSSEGNPLHRASGAYSEKKFLFLAADALNPESQSYTLAAKYDPSKMDLTEMKKVAFTIRRSAPELAGKIALAYLKRLNIKDLSQDENIQMMEQFYSDQAIGAFVESFIKKLNNQELLQGNYIDLITAFTKSSKDWGFKFLYQFQREVDSVKNGGRTNKRWFVKNVIDNIISKEEIEPIIEKSVTYNKEPDWKRIITTLEKKYTREYADRVVLKGKMAWHSQMKEYDVYFNYVSRYLENYGRELEFDWGYNEYAWSAFRLSNNKKILEKALSWSNKAVMENPNGNWIDTYANILYKLGERSLAIRWEEIAASLEPGDSNIHTNLNKMKNDTPTWSLK